MSQNRRYKYYDEYGQPVDQYGRAINPKTGRTYEEEAKEDIDPSSRSAGQYRKRSRSSNWEEREVESRPTRQQRPQRSQPPRRKKRKKRGSIVKKILLVVVLILALVIADICHLLTLYTYDDTNESSLAANTEDGIMTIALFGVDTRENDASSGTRADAIMLMSVDPKRKSIKLTSLMRDSLVDVPGHGQTKLCHAYGYGGPQMMLQTINEDFDMNVKEYMVVDFAEMASIIDSVGGVTVTLTDDEVKETNKYIDEYCWKTLNIPTQRIEGSGEQKLNGIQAMTYGRIRKGNTGGDWKRAERQSVVLNQVFSKATSNPITMLKFLNGLMPNVTSSMSKMDFVYMGLTTLVHGMPKMSHIRLPLDGEWQYGTTSSGASVIRFSDRVLASHLHSYIYDDIDPTKNSD